MVYGPNVFEFYWSFSIPPTYSRGLSVIRDNVLASLAPQGPTTGALKGSLGPTIWVLGGPRVLDLTNLPEWLLLGSWGRGVQAPKYCGKFDIRSTYIMCIFVCVCICIYIYIYICTYIYICIHIKKRLEGQALCLSGFREGKTLRQ